MSGAGRDPDEELREHNAAAFDAAGVDLTQIDMMLSLSPRERLDVLYETALSLSRLMPAEPTPDDEAKDIAVLPLLRATLARQRRKS